MRAVLTLLRWPLWVLAIGTGAKSFQDNPVLGSRRLNAWGLHRTRVRIAHAMTGWRRRRLSGELSREDRDAFARQGYVEWREVLPPDSFARMRDAILNRSWSARETIQGHTVTRRIAVDDAMLAAVPELKMLLGSRRWRGLLGYIAATRSEPLYYIQTILPHHPVTDGLDFGEDPQNAVHADTFHPNMKAWLFLTDVGPEDGPFNYVPGSHRLTPARLDWEQRNAMATAQRDRLSRRGSLRISQTELDALGLSEPRSFPVPANTLIVADLFGFHARGVSDRPSIRVELWAYSRRNPFLPWTGLDIGSLPGLAKRRIALLWRFREWRARHGGPYPHTVTEKRPADL